MAALIAGLVLLAPATAAAADPVPVLQQNGSPTLSPTFKVRRGQTLTVTPGTWAPTPASYSYAWVRCSGGQCSTIAGATAPTYTLTTDDVGIQLHAEETAHNSSGDPSQPAWTASIVPIFGTPVPVGNSLPTVTATGNRSGDTLSFTKAQWEGNPSAIDDKWLRCDQAGDNCVDAPNAARGSSLTLRPDHAGYTFRIEETARSHDDSNDISAPIRSTATSPAVLPDVPLAAFGTLGPNEGLRLSGYQGAAPMPGLTLTVSGHNRWMSGATNGLQFPILDYAYQWVRCTQAGDTCTPISGATGLSYTIQAADIGSFIGVEERASNAGGVATYPHRAFQNTTPGGAGLVSTKVVGADGTAPGDVTRGLRPITPPSVSGLAVVGATLTIKHGTWNPAAQGYKIQWSHCTDPKDQQTCYGISGATGPTYKVTKKDFGQSIRVNEIPGWNGEFIAGGQRSDFTDVVQTSVGRVLATGPTTTFAAPKAGKASVEWTAKSKGRTVVVAQGQRSAGSIGQLEVSLRLTAAGRSLLKAAQKAKRSVNLTSVTSFKPKPGNSIHTITKFSLLK